MTQSAFALALSVAIAGPPAAAPPPDSDSVSDSDSDLDSDSVSGSDSDSDSDSGSAPPPMTASEAEPAEPPPPEPSRSVWRTTEPPPPASAEPMPEPQFQDGVAPGGYWDPGEAPETAPKDGYEQRLAGYIVLPLGILTTASASAMLYLTAPGHCIERTQGLGYDLDEGECQDLLILNSVRLGYGAAAVITGAVLIAIGHHRKKKLEEWKRRRFRASLGMGGRDRRAVSAQFTIRF